MRHGQASRQAYGARGGDHTHGGLTDLGRDQARATGALMAKRASVLTAAVSGTLRRQQETLELILESFETKPTPVRDARWNEYDLDAILGGTGVASQTQGHDPDLQRLVDDGLTNWISGGSVGGETYADFRARCVEALNDIHLYAGSGQTALVVASAGSIMSVVAHLWKCPSASWIAMSRTVANASVTKLVVDRTRTSVWSLNEHAYLDQFDATGRRSLLTLR
ncbi:histidine phosphatase family protein [Mycolicibacterium goodii]|uniref:histidine phosphatase family protein n=1 Tax=Mycolicibacterium goodii TaxID=134601 RepID=UPI000C26427E|nr:histidine phosphatase family protein [Mycolicibacterium goodii]PJK19192.1 phosphoglycerate mutase [Mycolicibacterium goodii]